MRARFTACLGLLVLLGCGSNAPEVPPELLMGGSTCSAPGYPTEDIGTEPGQVLENACFVGYRAPDRVMPTAANRETVAFSDYYDPTGSKGVALLLINTAAIWCSVCVGEHHTLPGYQSDLGGRGLVILSTLFEDAQRDPASLEDVERWISKFDTNFPMVADPTLELGDYANPNSAPLNMLVDPRDMTILKKYVGDQGTVMWPYIESELARRSAAR